VLRVNGLNVVPIVICNLNYAHNERCERWFRSADGDRV
jgi:hypothetical protein